MLIECPSCHTRAKLPDSKEGAKVRCPQCSFVYVARAGGAGPARGRSRSSSTPIAVGTGIVVLLFVLVFLMKGDSEAPAPPVTEAPKIQAPPPRDSSGWNSEPVQLVRRIHDDAFARKEFELGRNIDVARAFAVQEARTAAAEGAPADLPVDRAPDAGAFAELPADERTTFQLDLLAALQADGDDNLVGAWRPFEGSVVAETDHHATVRVQLAPRDEKAGVALRWMEWRLVRDGERWKAYSWERWISPEEQRAERAARAPRAQRRELSDGSVVYEAEPRPIPYDAHVTPEQRQRIDGLIERLTNLERRDQVHVRRELTEIGKDAIAPLLTRLYHQIERGLSSDEDASRVALVIGALTDITGFVTTWKPHEALGATKERQESGLRQWFSWYDRKYRRFEVAAEGPDLLDEALAPKSEAEAREQERYRRAHEEAMREAARKKAAGSN